MDAQEQCVAWLNAIATNVSWLRRFLGSTEKWEELRRQLIELIPQFERARDGAAWTRLGAQLDELTRRHHLERLLGSAHRGDNVRGPTMRSGEPELHRALAPHHFAENDPTSFVEDLASLSDHLGAPKKQFDAYPHVAVPDTAFVGSTFAVDVALAPTPARPGAQAITIEPGGFAVVELEVEVVLPPDTALKPRNQLVACLRVPSGERSPTIRFAIEACEAGSHEITVIFRHGDVERGVVRCHILVCSEADFSAASPDVSVKCLPAAITIEERQEPLLVLNIQRSGRAGDSDFYRVCLRGHHTLLHRAYNEVIEISQGTQEQVNQLCAQLFDMIRFKDGRTREARLRAIGDQLAAHLLPESIRGVLGRDRLPTGTRLHIESDDAWIPWEMVSIRSKTGGRFLCEHFALTRWLRAGSIRPEIIAKSGLLVAPVSSGFDPTKERSALTALLGAPPTEKQHIDEVMERLAPSATAFDVLHFACHGVSAQRAPLGGSLLLDGGDLQPVDILPYDEDIGSAVTNACVFLNACEAGAMSAQLCRLSGWADRFISAGAAAVIAPSWAVRDDAAIAFAERFYGELMASVSVGEAARRARLAIRQMGFPDWLAYAVYADPAARVRRASASAIAA